MASWFKRTGASTFSPPVPPQPPIGIGVERNGSENRIAKAGELNKKHCEGHCGFSCC